MGAIFYIQQGAVIWQGSRKHEAYDSDCLNDFARLLVGKSREDQIFSALREGIRAFWDDAYDIVNPFGDRRGVAYDSVWTFDLDRGTLIQTRRDGFSSVPLSLACERPLTLGDFTPLSPLPTPTLSSEFPAPFWDLQVGDLERERAFLGRIIQDFGDTWRHLYRREQNQSTISRLAIATMRISALDFTITERTGWDRSPGGLYAPVIDLPKWESPTSHFIQAGQSWFVWFQDPTEGLQEIRRHYASQNSDESVSKGDSITYALLSLGHIILVCLTQDGGVKWTKPEALFDGWNPPTSRAIDLLLWMTRTQRPPTLLNFLPVEIQDRILQFTSASTVAAAKLGCELDLGSLFQWKDGGRALELEHCKRKRTDESPVESQLYFGPWMSAVSYKPGPGPNPQWEDYVFRF